MSNKAATRKIREYLESVTVWRLELQRCEARIRMLEEQTQKLTSNLSGMPRGSGGDHDRLLACLADETSQYSKHRLEAEIHLREVEAFINRLETPLHRYILLYRYVDGLRWSEILDRLQASGVQVEERQMFNIYGKALAMAQMQLINEESEQ